MAAIDYDIPSNCWSTPSSISHTRYAVQWSESLQISAPPAATPGAAQAITLKNTWTLHREQPETLTSYDVFNHLESFVKEGNNGLGMISMAGVDPSVLENMLDEWQHHTAFDNLWFVFYPSLFLK